MTYRLLIRQGMTLTPLDPEVWMTLSEDEQRDTYLSCSIVIRQTGSIRQNA
jgi:hypothetical protein